METRFEPLPGGSQSGIIAWHATGKEAADAVRGRAAVGVKAVSARAVLARRPCLVTCPIVVDEIVTTVVVGRIAQRGIVAEVLSSLHERERFGKGRIVWPTARRAKEPRPGASPVRHRSHHGSLGRNARRRARHDNAGVYVRLRVECRESPP